MVEPLLRVREVPTDRRALTGYLMVAAAAALFAINGAVAKVILSTGLSSPRLAEVRSTGAFAVLLAGILALRPQLLRVGRRELALFALFGVAGLVIFRRRARGSPRCSSPSWRP
jgi:drug/metabolite transporter (DMT)-like permease